MAYVQLAVETELGSRKWSKVVSASQQQGRPDSLLSDLCCPMPSNGTWSSKASLPDPRSQAGQKTVFQGKADSQNISTLYDSQQNERPWINYRPGHDSPVDLLEDPNLKQGNADQKNI